MSVLARALTMFVSYAQRDVGRTPGTGNAAYLPQDLPPITNIGAGCPVRFQWQLRQRPQIWQQQSVPTQGYGGLMHGQYLTQGLIDPSSGGFQ